MIYHVTVGERTLVVEVGGGAVTLDGVPHDVDLRRVGDGPVRSLLVDGASYRLAATPRGGGRWDVHLRGRLLRAEVVDERTKQIRAMTGNGASALGPRPVIAPMPGMVVRVEVAEGQTVESGQGMVIVEAMKMENELRAESAGLVRRVHVREGEAVEKDQILVELGPLGEDGEGS